MIKKAVEGYNKEEFFQTLVPMPEGEEWYGWNTANWGTKWDANVYDPVELDESNFVSLSFDTAWSPPIAFYEALIEQGFKVEAFYYEPGMAFCGIFDNGSDECFEIESWNSDWIAENIPEELNEIFGISDFADEDAELEEED
jgi:hypothetical protein